MQRWLSLLAGIAVVILAAFVALRGAKAPKPSPLPSGSGSAQALVSDAGSPSLDGGDLVLLDASDTDADPLGEFVPPLVQEPDGGPGYEMENGEAPPQLGPTAPRRVKYAVILVIYAGAQNVGPGARSKAAAKVIADQVAAAAKEDFRAAAAKGDLAVDALHADRGILEPATEYALFSLEPGGTAGPLDTPKGYWIVKRIE